MAPLALTVNWNLGVREAAGLDPFNPIVTALRDAVLRELTIDPRVSMSSSNGGWP